MISNMTPHSCTQPDDGGPGRSAARASQTGKTTAMRPTAVWTMRVKPSSRRWAMRRVAACACVEPIVKASASVMTFSIASERKQIGQKVAFLGRRQRRAIDVAIVAVADEPRVKAEAFRGLLSRIAGGSDEAAVARVDDIETPHEGGRPLRRRLQPGPPRRDGGVWELGRRLEEVAQRRNGAVVEVWPVEPQSAQRLRDVAWDLAEGFETPIAAFAEIVIGIAGKLGPHMRPVDVGAHFGDRDHGE